LHRLLLEVDDRDHSIAGCVEAPADAIETDHDPRPYEHASARPCKDIDFDGAVVRHDGGGRIERGEVDSGPGGAHVGRVDLEQVVPLVFRGGCRIEVGVVARRPGAIRIDEDEVLRVRGEAGVAHLSMGTRLPVEISAGHEEARDDIGEKPIDDSECFVAGLPIRQYDVAGQGSDQPWVRRPGVEPAFVDDLEILVEHCDGRAAVVGADHRVSRRCIEGTERRVAVPAADRCERGAD
jgi:hypothetical protein